MELQEVAALLGLVLEHGGDGVGLAHPLLVALHADEAVGPEGLVDLGAGNHEGVRRVALEAAAAGCRHDEVRQMDRRHAADHRLVRLVLETRRPDEV